MKRRIKSSAAFTLVELLVSMTVLTILLLIVANVIATVQRAWRTSSAKVSQFREGRRAFDHVAFALSQATLNNYYVYKYKNKEDPFLPPAKSITDPPTDYIRYSDLQFVCGPSSSKKEPRLTGLTQAESPGHAIFFQAPLGTSATYKLPSTLNGCGFFVRYDSDQSFRPEFLDSVGAGRTINLAYRYRLYEYRSNTEDNAVYEEVKNDWAWYDNFPDRSRPVANNVILLVISPRQPVVGDDSQKPTDIAPEYSYDSRESTTLKDTQDANDYQLPPLVDVTMVVLDEASAASEQFNAETGGGSATAPILQDVLKDTLFKKAEDYLSDLQEVEAALVDRKLNFRIFTGTVPIRASKWSKTNT